ncbi:hypothetical protein K2173_001928 [Erythroxylum novogranatense]|uniref:Uncharacterized protein n=1 Tax=Erythroxylum novogranatense TaxID=1862640 RepID=A0AAV8SP58_9ROSI|nr:hypothetical protein K2173_001928 [Erythroxylum novogranatense]
MMATLAPSHSSFAKTSSKRWVVASAGFQTLRKPERVESWSRTYKNKTNRMRQLTVVAAVGDVSADGTTYLIAGAAAVALLGTAFPIFFSRKDLCPECDGAGFIRQSAATLRANAARKDQAQIVCPRCNGLGKLNQIDK